MKRIAKIILICMSLILMMSVSYASESINTTLSTESQQVKAKDTVVLKVKLEGLNDIKYGVNAYKATLRYDDNIFEKVGETDFKTINNWEGLRYNPNTGEFVVYKRAGITEGEDIVDISLKIKEDVKASKTKVELVDVVASEGKKDLFVQNTEENEDAIVNIDIVEEQKNQNNKPTTNPNDTTGDTAGDTTDEGQAQKTPSKLPNTGDNFILLFILFGIEVIVVVVGVARFKEKIKNRKNKMYMSTVLALILTAQFIGTVYGAVSTFSKKGELNFDGGIDYADVSLLVSHLANIHHLDEGKTAEKAKETLENADMNSDGKITVTDLSILIQKIENKLDYEVTILDFTVNNNYPQKDEEITLSFKYDANYDATIKSVFINSQEYEISQNDQDGKYEVKVNVGNTSGKKEYKIEKVKLHNEKFIEIEKDNTVNIDVLKQILSMKDYNAVEDIENVSLDVSFNIEDTDKAFLSGTYTIEETNATTVEELENEENTQDKKVIQEGEVKVGDNKIKVKVEEGKNYKLSVNVEYNLSNGNSEEDMEYSKNLNFKKLLKFNPNYNFKMSDIKTYKSVNDVLIETSEFDIGEEITLKFYSTNSTVYVPTEVVVNGNTYVLEQENNTYTTIINGFDSVGKHELIIEKVRLSNGKEFNIENEKVEVDLIKKVPVVEKIRADEEQHEKQMSVSLFVRDEDKTLSKIEAILSDENGKEISTVDLTSQLVDSNLVQEEAISMYTLSNVFDISSVKLAREYKIKVIASYELLENDAEYVFTDKVIYEKEIEAKPVVNIKNVQVSNKYPEKNENVTLTYEIETNREDIDITHIMVNNLKCVATKHIDNDDNITYSVTLPAGTKPGEINLHTTEFAFASDNIVASTDNTVKVDVLKTKPTSEKFLQEDNINEGSVTLTARIVDPDGAFISGKATLISNSDGAEVESKDFNAEKVTFTINNVELDKEYTLVAKMTYDRDSKIGEDNYVENEIFRERPIQLIADYELNLSNIKTYYGDKETRYFERGQKATLTFNSTNKTAFYPVKAVINGNEYALEKQANLYKATIPVVSKFGPQTVTIQKIILNNTKELDITSNNTIDVGILKLRPTITDFGFEELENNAIDVSFNVNDTENAITGGKVIITDENGTKVAEEPFNKETKGIKFTKNVCEEYEIKVIANYDLDTNTITQNENEYTNQELLSETINVSQNRLFEIKDITGVTLYGKLADGNVAEISKVTEQDLTDLSKYIVKVQTKGMPTFYANIESIEIDEENKLNFILDYKDVIQYNDGKKNSKLKVEYAEMKNGVAENKSIESLLEEIAANPSGTFELTQDYDATNMKSGGSTVIDVAFSGTLNGNGHTIRNLKKPLFNTLVDNANITNLVLEDVELIGATSKGAIANSAENTTISNVHVKGLSFITGVEECGGMIGDLKAGSTIKECSITKLNIKLNYFRVAGIAGKMAGSTIKDCYVEGTIESVISTLDGIGGIAGDSQGTPQSKIENCITKVNFVNNTRAKNNGGILGLARNSNTILTNNVSLDTGTGANHVYGSTIHSTSDNNYELEESELISNVSASKKNLVKRVAKANLNKNFFVNDANFSEAIWNFEDVSYDRLPRLKNSDPNGNTEEIVKSNNKKIYIPEYERVSKISGYDTNKEITYNNLHRLMPYYDAKYLITDGLKIANDNVLNTKIIKHILPFANNKLVTYLTTNSYDGIDKIKVEFDDNTFGEYAVTFDKFKNGIAIYQIDGLNINYAFDNYVVNENSEVIDKLTEYIKSLDYNTVLDPLTQTADHRQYRDNYNGVIKNMAREIALKILQNDEDSILMLNNNILNKKIEQELIGTEKINKMIYAYNYYQRWYGFEIGGANVSDIILFDGKMYSDSMTFYNTVREVLVGNMNPGNTDNFYVNCLKKYTGSSTIGYFLDYIIINIGDYEDVNDWFTEYFGSRNVLSEVSVDDKPEILYRGWYQLKKTHRMILPVITLPSDCAYIISGPAHLQIGPQQLYHLNPGSAAGKAEMINKVKNHTNLVKKHFTTLSGSFDSGRWNNYCIMVYDCTRIITGYKTTYIPGTSIPIGTSPVTQQQKVGTNNPFCKNFSEVLGLWQPAGSSAGVGNTAGFLWFQATPGLTNYDTWTHEFEHALYDKIMLYQRGCRLGLETLTQGNVEQRVNWSENNLTQDVGPYYFNTSFYLNKEGNATQNLTPERINTKEKLENYFKGQQNALDLLDYVEGMAFINLTPEQQSRIATRMTQSGAWSSWGTITADQATSMNLTSLEALYNNRIILRPSNAWGVSVRGLNVINSIGGNDYGFESVWVNRWYIGHNDTGAPDAFSAKRNFFEMLGYAGVDGYVTYGSRASSNDLDAIKKITKKVTGSEMDWKQYKMSRYATVEENMNNNKYIDVQYMIERFTEALRNDADKGDRNISQRTNLRKIYYHYLKSATNDFIDDPLGSTIEVNHIKTAKELVEKINAKPYGYYVLDNDIDFSGMTTNVTNTFMGRLDGNGHKIIGNKIPIFNKIRYGYVGNIIMENTDIPRNITNAGALSYKAEYSTVEKIKATNLQIYFGSKNDLSLIGGAVSNVITRDCAVERLTIRISNKEEFVNKINNEKSGIFEITGDIDFTGYTSNNATVITDTFTGKINGNGHKISNLTNLSLFDKFNGTIENLTIENVNNIITSNYATAFAHDTNAATVKNITFKDITLSGDHRVAVVAGIDNANSVFENIKVLNSNVTGTGVYVSNFIGRKYGGSIKNVYVQGQLNIVTTENAGLVGAMQQAGNGSYENVITDVNITKLKNTYNPIEKSIYNGSLIGNIYATNTAIKNCISFGNMTGYTDTSGEEFVPYKCVGAEESFVKSCFTKCYEVTEEVGSSRVTENTAGHLDTISRANLNTDFYKGLGFDEELWDFSTITTKGYPTLK